MAKAVKVVTDSGSTYMVKPMDNDQWGVFPIGEDVTVHVFTAPEDASTAELTAEVDFFELTADDSTDSEDDYEYDDEPYYA